MGLIAECPPLQLHVNPEFLNIAGWTLTGDAVIENGYLFFGKTAWLPGQAFQTIDTKKGDVYRFEYEILWVAGDPAEGVAIRFGTPPNHVWGGLTRAPGVYTIILADPDGTGRAEIRTVLGMDDLKIKIAYLRCVSYANWATCNLGLLDSDLTFSQSWLIAADKVMLRLVNENDSVNQLVVVEI